MKLGDHEITPIVLGDYIVDKLAGEDAPVDDAVIEFVGQAEGAIRNGAQVRKAVYEEGDTFQIGTVGTVVASVGPITDEEAGAVNEYGYMIVWAPIPDWPVFTRGRKIEEVVV